MNKFIVYSPNLQHISGVLFTNVNENRKYKSFLHKLNSSLEVKKFNGGGSHNAIDIKNFLHKVKELFESEFQNLASHDDLKSDFRIIIPWQRYKDEINELKINFEFVEGCCVTQQDITNQ